MSAETIWIASGMGVAIVAMALYIKSLHKHATTKLTDALIQNAQSSDHLADAIDKLPDAITNKLLVQLKKK